MSSIILTWLFNRRAIRTEVFCFFTAANEVWDKVIFLHLSVILFTGGSTWAGTPSGRLHPWAGTPPPRQVAPGKVSPGQVHPPGRYPPSRYALRQVHHPGRYTTQAGTPLQAGNPPWSMRGRYASYWKAFLSHIFWINLNNTQAYSFTR